MSIPRMRFTSSLTRQRGMATIMIVLLAGLALTATALGVMHAVRGAQEKHVAVHAATHAQAGAWAGVELFRLYLEQLNADDLESLKDKKDEIAIKEVDSDRKLSVKIINVPAQDNANAPYRVIANISNPDKAARATSTIQAVYSVVSGGSSQSGPQNPWDSVVNINGNLNTGGGITVKGGDAARVNVDGNISLGGSLVGIKTLRATGNISLTGGTAVDDLFANGNLSLTNGATANSASALGNILVKDGAKVKLVYANDGIDIANLSTGDSVLTAKALKKITVSGGATVNNMYSKTDVSCPSIDWKNFDSIHVGGNAINCPPALDKIKPLANDAELQPLPLQPFTPPKPRVDAYELKDSANYVFEYDGQIMVSVRNVNGIANGIYRLGKIQLNYQDKWGYLCSAVDGNGNCRDECSIMNNGSCIGPGVANLRKITQGTWDGDKSITYNASTSTWTLVGSSDPVVAPGALWFQGNVELGNGTFRNTILATGNITTANGAHRTWALNYAGFKEVCTPAYSYYKGLHPTNFCDPTQMKSNSVGNIALLAGGYVGKTFSGGVITLGASTEIYGSVVAGDLLNTGGSTKINGYITAAKQGTSTGSNTWGGGTTIDLSGLSNLPNYDPSSIPDMSGNEPCGSNCDPEDSDQSTVATLQWSRYL